MPLKVSLLLLHFRGQQSFRVLGSICAELNANVIWSLPPWAVIMNEGTLGLVEDRQTQNQTLKEGRQEEVFKDDHLSLGCKKLKCVIYKELNVQQFLWGRSY